MEVDVWNGVGAAMVGGQRWYRPLRGVRAAVGGVGLEVWDQGEAVRSG